MEPEVPPGLDGLLGHAEIAVRKGKRLVGAQHELAGLAGRQLDVIGIDNARLKTVDDAPHGSRLLHLGRGADDEIGFG